jgi:pectinesterase
MRQERRSFPPSITRILLAGCVLLAGCGDSPTEGDVDAAGVGGATGSGTGGHGGSSGSAGNGGGAGTTGGAGTVGTGGGAGSTTTGGSSGTGTGGVGGGGASGGGGSGASGGSTGGATAGRGGSTAGTGATAGAGGSSTGGAGGAGGARGGTTGTAGGAGGARGGTSGTAGGSGAGGARGGTTGNAGTSGNAGTTGSAGSNATCTSIAGTSTRPQLTSAEAANYTIAKYLASGPDAWDPTAGLGAASSFTPSFTVASDGSGTHTSVQAALTAAASGSTRRYILVKPGTYRGVVSISGSTPITLYGADGDASRVVIVNSASSGDAGGTAQSSTFTSKAAGLQLMNLTISNDFATPTSGSNIQAVALYTTGDKTVLQNVRLHGFQDTLYVDSSSATGIARVYIKNSFIEGDTDFIFGRAVLVIDGGEIHYLALRKGTGSGVHFAPSTHVNNMYGFLATHVNFTAESGAPSSKISLGRSWDQSSTTPTPNGQAVIRESTLGGHINKTAPWAAAATSGRAYSATGNRFNEYCNGGPGAGP